MMRRRTHITLFLFFTVSVMYGQQTAQYSNYVFNHYGINPAVAGTKECVDMRAGYRTQWVGFDGHPTTMFANAHFKLPNRRGNVHNRHGVGIMVESDAMGPFSRTNFYLGYAYHLPLTHKWRMGMGLFAGFNQFRFSRSDMFLIDQDDEAVPNSQSFFLWGDLIPGVLLYSENAYIGFTIRQILRNRWKDIGFDSRHTYHYGLNLGKEFETRKDVSFIPSAMIKWAPWSKFALDINVMVEIKKHLQVGLSYRNMDAVIGLLKFDFLKYFSLAYAFDFTTSRIRYGSSNTHEIILGISACPRTEHGVYDCPVFR